MRLPILVLALAGCLRSPDYHCTSATDCTNGTSQGVCESNDYCSFTDPSCASGQRFGELSGSLANQCVGGTSGGDGGVDGPPRDAGQDGAAAQCPTGYNSVSGGNSGHKYRKLASADWQTQVTACAADGAHTYLAIPDDSNELGAIRGFGGDAWVGISDLQTAGSYVTVLGSAATYLPWGNGEPSTALHCVEEVRQQHVATLDCTSSLFAICECAP